MMMRGSGMIFGHMNGVLALVALALGYIVWSMAQKEKDLLRTVGYIIGITIIAISSVIVLAKVLLTAKICLKMCPFKGEVMSAPAPVLPKR